MLMANKQYIIEILFFINEINNISYSRGVYFNLCVSTEISNDVLNANIFVYLFIYKNMSGKGISDE